MTTPTPDIFARFAGNLAEEVNAGRIDPAEYADWLRYRYFEPPPDTTWTKTVHVRESEKGDREGPPAGFDLDDDGPQLLDAPWWPVLAWLTFAALVCLLVWWWAS